jgi:hypothetical protein
MKKHIALLLGGAELLAAAALGLTVRAAPASAAPTQNGANLFITQDPANPQQLLVSVHGSFPMSGYDAPDSSTSIPVSTRVV